MDEYPITENIWIHTITRKVAICGAAEHATSLYDTSFTYRMTRVDVRSCRIIPLDRFVWQHGTKTNIELNQNAYVNMYIQRQHYASTQWDNNQLKCIGEIFRIDVTYVSNRVSYEGNEWLIQ